MAQSYIQLNADGSGKKLQTWDNTVGGNDVYTEATTPTDSTGVEKATATNPLRIDPTGTTTQPTQDASDGTPGSAAPSTAIQIGGTDGTDLRAITMLNGAPTGAEYAPVVRGIDARYGAILTTATLSGGATYDSSTDPNWGWFDTNKTGSVTVICHSKTNVVSTSFIIYGSDDQTNLVTLAQFPNTSTGNAQLQANITTRYWKVVYINGASAQGNFTLSYTTYNALAAVSVSNTPSNPGSVSPLSTAGLVDGDTAYAWISSAGTSGVLGVVAISNTSGATTTTVMNREPNNFASAQLTTGTSVSLVAAVSAQKWRLRKYQIQMTANAAISGGAAVVKISLQDGGTDIPASVQYVYVPGTAVTTTPGDSFESGWIDLGKVGYVSSAVNQALTLAVSTALTTGTINAIVAYCGPATSV